MKKVLHRADSRGYFDHGWLKTYHSFSFGGYHNPEKVHFGVLRVLNDDWVAPGNGFGKHPHDNMEIISIPLKGTLAHADSEGNAKPIKTNDVQIMSAGSGIVHSEFNHSRDEAVNFLQIWVFPKERNIKPRYDQKTFAPEDRKNKWQLVVAPEKESKALWINQDAYFAMTNLDANKTLSYQLHKEQQGVYIFAIEGSLEVAGEKLSKRDAIGLSNISNVELKAITDTEILVIEIPMTV